METNIQNAMKKRPSRLKRILLIGTWISFVISTVTLCLSRHEIYDECYANDCNPSAPLLTDSVCRWEESGNGNPCSATGFPTVNESLHNVTVYADYFRLFGCEFSEYQQFAENSGDYGLDFVCYRQHSEEECYDVSCHTMCDGGCERHLLFFVFVCILTSLSQAPFFKHDKRWTRRGFRCGILNCSNEGMMCKCAVMLGKIAGYLTSYALRFILIGTGMESTNFMARFGLGMVAAMVLFVVAGCWCRKCDDSPLDYVYVLVKSLVYIELFVIFILSLTGLSLDWNVALRFFFKIDFLTKVWTSISIVALTVKNCLSLVMTVMSYADCFENGLAASGMEKKSVV